MLPLLEAVSGRMHTNLNLEQMLVLGDILNNTDLDKIEFVTLPGGAKTISGRSYYVPSTKKVRELAKRVWG
jgi:anionic cell wall polymer biosynthesis LytR-Cps2A-Psr (LCP) family protein